MGGLRSMLFGRKEQDAMREELERLSRRVLRVRRILKDPDVTTFTLVTIPEVMALNETRRAHRALVDLGIPTGAVVVNRLTPRSITLPHPTARCRAIPPPSLDLRWFGGHSRDRTRTTWGIVGFGPPNLSTSMLVRVGRWQRDRSRGLGTKGAVRIGGGIQMRGKEEEDVTPCLQFARCEGVRPRSSGERRGPAPRCRRRNIVNGIPSLHGCI